MSPKNTAGIWYHGSNKKFSLLREGSTITPNRALAEAFHTSRRYYPVKRMERCCITEKNTAISTVSTNRSTRSAICTSIRAQHWSQARSS